jgi:[ribosomal protein S5]-alanine N-acetyltransferase
MFPNGFQTARLVLRPIAAGDAPAIFDGYAQDPEVTRFLTWRPHRVIAETDAYVAHCLSASVARTYVLMERRDDTLLGALDLRRPEAHRLSFGYVLARLAWGQGLMTEALAEVVRWAMAQPPVWRIGAVCDVENVASARVMEKAGLVREGVLRRWGLSPNLGDAPRDCWVFARTRDADAG